MADSVVLSFMKTIYRETRAGSWQGLHLAMQQGLSLAIKANFKFEKEDFRSIIEAPGDWRASGLGWEKWAGTDNPHSQGERFYTLAVECGNTSAAIAFEFAKGRKPFIYLGKRLAIGVRFEIIDDDPPDGLSGDHPLYVSSFSQDGTYINCCSYVSPSNPRGWRGNGPLMSRRKLFVSDLKALEKKKALKEVEDG